MDPSPAVSDVGDLDSAARAQLGAEDYVSSVWSAAFDGCAHCAWKPNGDGRRRPLFLRRDVFPLAPCPLGAGGAAGAGGAGGAAPPVHMCPAHTERVLHYLYGPSLAPPSRLQLLRGPLLRAARVVVLATLAVLLGAALHAAARACAQCSSPRTVVYAAAVPKRADSDGVEAPGLNIQQKTFNIQHSTKH